MEAARKKPTRRRSFRHLPFSRRPQYGADLFERRIRQRIRLSLRIPERIPIVDWLEKHIYLPKDSTRRAGKFKAYPYQRDIINDMGDTSLDEIVCMKSIRVGWTQMIGLALAYCVAHLGSPAMFVTINIDKAKEFAKTFWEPLFDWRGKNTILKAIRRRFIKGEKQDQWSDWYLLNGGAMRIRAAGSSDAFRGNPARYAGGDEPDSENWKEGKEGSKIELLRGRTVEFDDGRIIIGCSPTNTMTSRVWKHFQQTDMRRRFVPCPHCSGVYDVPQEQRNNPPGLRGFQYLKFGTGQTEYGIKFVVENSIVVNAQYQCEHCHLKIDEVTRDGWSWKKWMDEHGRWVPTNGTWECIDREKNTWIAVTPQMFGARCDEYRASWEAGTDLGLTNGIFVERTDDETGEIGLEPVYTTARPKKRGYHIWSAYSQMAGITWIRLASDWLIKLSEGRNGIQGFVNQHCGDPWEPGGLFSLPDESELSSVTVPYDAEVPLDVVGLTMGVDVQPLGRIDGSERPRLECSVYGHGRRGTAYLIGHWIIDAPWPSQSAEMALDTLIQRKFKRADGREFQILATCVDSGTATMAVYDYCQRRARWNVFAVKGAKEEGGVKKDYGLISTMASTNKDTGHTWYMVSTLTGKEELAYKLDRGPQIEGIFFPHSSVRAGNGRFFAGLVAERAVTIGQTGRVEWKRKGQLTGEPLDCFVYAMAARELARRIFAPFRNLDMAADYLKLPEEPSLATVDRKTQDRSAQADSMAGVIEPPARGSRTALPVKRRRPPQDFTVKPRPSGGGSRSRGRGGWGRF